MHPQLQAIAAEFGQASERLQDLAVDFSDEVWLARPAYDRWSVSECVSHLNLTARAFLPVLNDGLEQARSLGGGSPNRYRRDPLGWLLWVASGPPARLRTRTAANFVPSAADSPAQIRATFESLQAEQIAILQAADGLPLQKVRINSPFDPRVRYNLFSAFTILPRHQHRHLWQAEQAGRMATTPGHR